MNQYEEKEGTLQKIHSQEFTRDFGKCQQTGLSY